LERTKQGPSWKWGGAMNRALGFFFFLSWGRSWSHGRVAVAVAVASKDSDSESTSWGGRCV